MAFYNVANAAGAAVRAAINTVFGKLQRNYYGSTDPNTAGESTPGMLWVDTSGAQPVLKMRNASDTLWVTLGTLSSGDLFELAQTTAFSRTLIDDASASAMRTTLGLGEAATLNTTVNDTNFQETALTQLVDRATLYQFTRLKRDMGYTTANRFIVDGINQTYAAFPWNPYVEFPKKFSQYIQYSRGSLTDKRLLLKPLQADKSTIINPAFITVANMSTKVAPTSTDTTTYNNADGLLLDTLGGTDGSWKGWIHWRNHQWYGDDDDRDGLNDSPTASDRMYGVWTAKFELVSTVSGMYYMTKGQTTPTTIGSSGTGGWGGFLCEAVGSAGGDLNGITGHFEWRECDMQRFPVWS